MTTEESDGQSTVNVRAEFVPKPRSLSPEDAFKIIGSETRLAILDTLWGPKEPGKRTFADLRKAIGMQDGSQFNFHLKKLVDGGFVEKIDGEYSIRQAGARVICTVRTGYLTDHPEIDTFETGGRCYACRSPLEARYEDEMFIVECTSCERLHARMWFPPNGLLGRTSEGALLAAEMAMRAAIGLSVAGICSVCNGPTERTLSLDWSEIPVRSDRLDPERDGPPRAWYVCTLCGAWVTLSPGDAVIDHPAVVDLYRKHGIDIHSLPHWELPWAIDTSVLEVIDEKPLRIQLTITLEGTERILLLDETFDVLSVE